MINDQMATKASSKRVPAPSLPAAHTESAGVIVPQSLGVAEGFQHRVAP